MQQPSHHLNTIQQQQNQSDSDEINNCSDDRNSNSNEVDADNSDAMMENDPDAAAELLRQKIEETNQKISDYFRQQ